MLSDIRDILIISTPRDLPLYELLLGDGSKWGLNFSYQIQPNPGGLAEAFLLGKNFIGEDLPTLILGDNIFYGHDFETLLKTANNREKGATLFAYHVNDPERYGIVEYDKNKSIISIDEKPINPKSNYAITGLYYYDNNVLEYAKNLIPSTRGELEITDLNKFYLRDKNLNVQILERGYAWLDTGTHHSLLEASKFVETIQERQGLKIAIPEEIAFKKNWINHDQLEKLALSLSNNEYGKYLANILLK
jgi:glucose-1-phosphate thymidylyltransferase